MHKVQLRVKCNRGAVPWIEAIDSTMVIVHNDEYGGINLYYDEPRDSGELYDEILSEAKKRNDSDLKLIELSHKLSSSRSNNKGRDFARKWMQNNIPDRTLYFSENYVVVSLPYTFKAYEGDREFLANAHALVLIGGNYHAFPVKWPHHRDDVAKITFKGMTEYAATTLESTHLHPLVD